MLVGAVMNNVSVFKGDSSVMMTSYVPMMAHWSFYLSLILFAVGALVACGVFFGTLVVARRDKTYEGSIPLVTFGAMTAAIISLNRRGTRPDPKSGAINIRPATRKNVSTKPTTSRSRLARSGNMV